MSYLKFAIATAVVLIVLLGGYIFLPLRSNDAVGDAYQAFVQSDFDRALSSLKSAANQMPPNQLQLYLGYIYRAKHQWQQSDEAFASAEEQTKQHKQPTLMLAINLNQALNAYLQGNSEKLEQAITNADELNEENSWLEFFKGLEAYQNEKYGLALNIWTVNERRLPLSSWMRHAFDAVFTPYWMATHLARCQIETGNFQVARQILEEAMEKQPQADASGTIDFLMGLSYAREAESKPFNGGAPDYKLALSYFNRIPPTNADFSNERPRLLMHLTTIVQSLIKSHHLADLPFYAAVLDAWGAQKELNEIQQQLIDALNTTLVTGQLSQIKALAGILQQTVFEEAPRNELQQRLQEFAKRALEEDDLSKAINLWELSQTFSKDFTRTSRLFTNKTASQILAMLASDENNLKNTTPYIAFWTKAETDPATRLAFANRLLNIATETLQTQNNKEKALALYRIALKMPAVGDQTAMHQEVVAHLSKMYSTAIERDAIEQLPAIFSVIQALDLKEIDSQREREIPRQLAAAETLLGKGEYDKAMQRARWVATLDSDNQAARLIAGRVLYWQANYVEALGYLAGVRAPDLELLEAIAVSQILSGSEAGGNSLLDSIRKKRTIHPESVERVGLGLMMLGRYADGETWLQQIENPDTEVLAGLAYSALRRGNAEEALAAINRIPSPESNLEGIQGMLARTEIMMNQPEKAEQRLLTLLAQQDSSDTSHLSPAFLKFDRKVLQSFNRYAVAGYFFKEVKHQNDMALKYLNMIKQPAPDTRLLKGQILMALGKPLEAVSEFQQAYAESLDSQVKTEVMPRLAQALTASGQFLEALGWYRKFFDEQGDHLRYREDYAQLLMTLRRYDLAIQQFVELQSKGPLTPNQTVLFINSLVGNGKFDQVTHVGVEALSAKSPLSIAQKLIVARAMVIINQQESTWPLLKALPQAEKLTADETVALLQFLMEIGSYAQATALATNRETLLTQTPSGLLTVAELYLRLGQTEEALKTAEAANALDPENSAAVTFISNHTMDPQVLDNQLEKWRRATEENSRSSTAILNFAHAVTAASHLAVQMNQPLSDALNADQKKALALLTTVNKNIPDIPGILFLMGELHALQNNSSAAIEFYVNAARLSPSFAKALLQLARQYRLQEDTKHAIAALNQVTEYEPDNAAAWEALGELYALEGYLNEASTFYQKAIQFQPNRIENYLAVASVLLELRSPEDAQRVLTYAAKIQPDNIAVLKLLLKTLYDTALEASAEDPKQLEADREAAAEALKRLTSDESKQ